MPRKVGRNNQKPPVHTQPRRYIAWMTFQGSGKDEDRGVGQGIKEKGWKWFVENRVLPLEKLLEPEDAIALHCPFGSTPGVGTMEADQAVKAAHTHTYLLESFQSAWLPVSSKREVICYFGDLARTESLSSLVAPGRKGQWLARLADSYRIALGSEMTLGFDVMHKVPEYHPAYRFVRLAQALTGKAYVEPTPTVLDPHMADLPWIVMEDFYKQHFSKWPEWALPEKQLTGERIRVMNSPETLGMKWDQSDQWLAQWVASCWRGHWTPAVGADWFIENGITVREAVEKYL